MVFSVSPSVTFREIDATAVIPAIATPPAALVGVFRWGPINERILVTSEDELVSRFQKPKTYTYVNSSNTSVSWTNHETFFVAADFLSYASAMYVTRVVSANTDTLTATSTNFTGKYPGALGNAIEVSYVTDAADYKSNWIADTGTIRNANTSIDFNTNTFVIETTENIIGSIANNDILRVGNSNVGYQNLNISSVVQAELVDLGANTTDPLDDTTYYRYTLIFSNKYALSALDYTELDYVRMWKHANYVGDAPTSGNMHIIVSDKTGDITGTAGTVLEIYENVSKSTNATLPDGGNNYYKTVVENKSAWIEVISASTLHNTTISGYETLANGSDGLGENEISFGKIALGWDLYKDANEVDIAFLIQGKAIGGANVANYIVQNIAETRKDCIALLSPSFDDVVAPTLPQTKLDNILAYRAQVQSSSYWVMDSGYKYRYDKYNDVFRWVPLNGDIAGLHARVKPWESPAGYKRGIIKNAFKLAYNPNKDHRDILYGKDINPVMSQVGQGILLFGDKTGLGLPSAFNRINVRRLFITVEKAIATTSASFLFDFNDEFTQTQFKNMVEPLLRDIQGQRGIIDFRVVSDGTVNTPDIIDRNIFRGNIFIKPARSISNIELTFVATRTGVSFDEIVGQF